MRIAQVAPLHESVPPRLYGGTERVVSYLTEALVEAGHTVTLFASGDSVTRAELVPCWPAALRLADCEDALIPHVLMVERVLQRIVDFDVVHFHIEHVHLPLVRRTPTPCVTTVHNRQDLAQLQPLYAEYRDLPLVSISTAQRRPLPQAAWAATVLHGLPSDLLAPGAEVGEHAVFLGRVSPEKGLEQAIAIARRTNLPLRIAAKIGNADRPFFDDRIKPLLAPPDIEYVGEITESEKGEFLGSAKVLLFPIDWPEPFGLVMIEAMACGTPTIAYRRGAVPEVIDDGVTGFIVDDLEHAARAVARIDDLERARIRELFEHRFSARRMAADYVRVYEQVIERARRHGRDPRAQAVA